MILAGLAARAAADPVIGVLPPAAGGAVRVQGDGATGSLLRLEAAASPAGAWQEIGRFHDELFPWPDGSAGGAGRRFYRLVESVRSGVDDWKNQLLSRDDAFLSQNNLDQVRWVKFALRPDEPWRVYFQDSVKHPFHYDFASQRLAPFIGMTRTAFDAVTLRTSGQQLVLGAVLQPPRATTNEYAVQFVGLDPYPAAKVAEWFRSVRDAVHAPTGAGALYMPVHEQADAARREEALLLSLGVPVAAVDRWTTRNHVYAPGWAVGRLRFVPAAQIGEAFAAGTLLPSDVLLTDGVPAETPLVAGILALTPQTPNSHTAILAQSFGIPFAHLPEASEQARLRTLDGRKVVVRATISLGLGAVKVFDAEGVLTPGVEAELLALKVPEPIGYSPRVPAGQLSRAVELLQPSDVRHFGGKAVNYGLLRRTIPANCPAGIAFSFDLWDAFLDQVLPASGRTLRAEIDLRLAPHRSYPPPQMAQMKTALAGVRTLIRQTEIPTAQRTAILAALGGFDPMRKIRFRSSTNLEDGDTFTGAGLYDSYSGCLADDTDGDTAGPSHCDPDEPEERGVLRAIQRVFASYYNDNAWLERIRHGVTESECGMAVLVHHSFPDKNELANGVASLAWQFQSFGTTVNGSMVTQAGAESVTNPDGSAAPEVVDMTRFNATNYFEHRQNSSRVPLGATVLQWQGDYAQFANLFAAVGTAWRQLNPSRTRFSLDFEYKKDALQGLVVKQVREIPQPAAAAAMAPWLIEELVDLVVAQKEAGTVWANHRLKSRWLLRATSGRLTPDRLAAGLHREGRLEHAAAGAVAVMEGPLASWPGAGLLNGGATHVWTMAGGQQTWQLQTTVTTSVSGSVPPVVGCGDFPVMVAATHAVPQPVVDERGRPATVTAEFAVLEPPRAQTPGSIRVERVLETGRGLTVRTVFLWPEEPNGPTAGYTAPLLRFERTEITGLTARPVILTDYWSQTYRPGHHNFTEEFVFEPGLAPDLPADQRAELAAAGIRALHIMAGMAGTPAWVLTTSGQLVGR